ncbi:MAG: hypothetical protein PHO37_04985 [Kiritimatiellae bacterium]|nr:hypothetical protein [Kiritimatiellia bacterium]
MIKKPAKHSLLLPVSALAALLIFSGCVTGNKGAESAIAGLRVGSDAKALAWAEKMKESWYSKQLGYLEAGRVRMLSGDFTGSSTNFAAAIDTMIDQTDEGPVIKVGDVGANIMAGTVTDDRTRPYNLPAYEFIQALNYQMINHLFLSDISAAGVEARRAVFAQDAIAEKYGSNLKKNADKQAAAVEARAEEKSVATDKDKADSLTNVDAKMVNMAPVLEKSRNSYENGLVWYLCGAILEEQGDQSNASLSYRKANELAPDNPYVRKDFLRMLRTQDQVAYRALMEQYKMQESDLLRSGAEVVVVFEESFVPQRKSVKVPLPVGGTLTSADFPIYEEGLYRAMSFEIGLKNGPTLGGGSPAVNLQALAYHDLKEKIPGIVLRNVTRIGTRIAAQQVANHAGNDALKIGVLAFNAISTVINKADTRAWYTLPAIAYLSCHPIQPGQQTIYVRNPATGYQIEIPVEVNAGERRLIWIADIEGCSRIGTASLSGKGSAPTFKVDDSLLTGPRALYLPR